MKYATLISIKLKHTYYADGNCPDFSITATTQTEKLLNSHRCVIKPNGTGLRVYVPLNLLDNDKSMIPFPDPCHLLFQFKLKTDEFAQYTDQRIEFSNPTDVVLYQNGVVVESKRGILTTPMANNPLLTISIKRDFNNITALPDTDEIRFFAKPAYWFYYVVADQIKNNDLAIINADNQDATTWQRLTQTDSDRIYAQLTQQYPDKAIFCFSSGQTIECYKFCTKHFQLNQGTTLLLDHLPVPSYRNFFNVASGAGSTITDAIYTIVNTSPAQH
jgi:hypothetical protein